MVAGRDWDSCILAAWLAMLMSMRQVGEEVR